MKYISKSLLTQSIPSLIISLVGLSMTGSWLESTFTLEHIKKYPLLLMSTCILTFKGNIELILATHLSTMSHSVNLTRYKYRRYVFDNCCLVLSQSIVIGVSVGLVGAAKMAISGELTTIILYRLIAVSALSCSISTLFVLAMMIITIEVAIYYKINPDHIILPGVSSFGDFLSVALCIYFLELYTFLSPKSYVVTIVVIIGAFPIPAYFSAMSKRKIHQQPINILILTYFLSTLSGYLFETFSRKSEILASLCPVFCGLCGSTSYIYLNKKMTASENNADIDKEKTFSTILVISIVVSIVFLTAANCLRTQFSPLFNILFIFLSIAHVIILLAFIDILNRITKYEASELIVVGIPLITSISDLLGTLILSGMFNVVK